MTIYNQKKSKSLRWNGLRILRKEIDEFGSEIMFFRSMEATISYRGELNRDIFFRFYEDKTSPAVNWFIDKKNYIHNEFNIGDKVRIELRIYKGKLEWFHWINKIQLDLNLSKKSSYISTYSKSHLDKKKLKSKNKILTTIKCKHGFNLSNCRWHKSRQKRLNSNNSIKKVLPIRHSKFRKSKTREKLFTRNPNYYTIVQGGGMS